MELRRFCLICGNEFDTGICAVTCSKDCNDIYSRQERQYAEYILSASMPKAPGILGLSSVDEYQDWKQRQRQGLVYFIQSAAGPIKIGFSRDVESRLASLQAATAWQLELLATVEGTPETEAEMHGRFDDYRIRGEWFKASEEILKFIAQL